ncbi:unnamed protein product, partial [Urochloa humidicola]
RHRARSPPSRRRPRSGPGASSSLRTMAADVLAAGTTMPLGRRWAMRPGMGALRLPSPHGTTISTPNLRLLLFRYGKEAGHAGTSTVAVAVPAPNARVSGQPTPYAMHSVLNSI